MPRGPTAGTKRQRAKPSATKQQDADAKESEPVVVQESGETDGLGALELGQAEDFLLPDAQRASVMKHATKRLFDFARLEERNKTGGRSAGPLDELHLDGFDTEQIWHMLELYNTPLVQTASRKLEQLLSDTHGDISLLPEQSNLFQNAKQMKLPPGVKATEPQQQRQQPKQQQEQQQQQQQQQQKQQEQHLLSDDEDDNDDDNDDDDDDDDDGNTGRKSKGTTAMKVVEQQRAAKTKAKAKGKAKDGDGDAGRGVIEEEEEDGFVRRRRVLAAATKTQQSKSTSAPAKHAMAVDTPAGKRGGKASDSDDNNDESEESDGAGWELGVDLTQELESDDEAREARYEDFFDPPEVIAAREARMAARRQKRQEQRAAERAARRAMKSKSKAAPHDYSDGDDDDDDDDDSDEEDELRADFDPDDDDMIDDGDDSDDDDDNMDVEVDSDDDDGGATHKNNKTQTPNTKRKKKKKSGSGAAALFGDEDWDDGGGGDHDGGDDDDEDEEKDSGADGEDADDQFGHTRHAERLERMKRKISEIEAEHLNPDKHWTLTGEVRGKQRPQNSLLEAALEYEQASKMVPVITEQTTQSLEQLIARRVCDGAFDDPVRKDPPSAEDLRKPFRPKVVLDDKKSSKSLAEIYEKEFIDKRDNVSEFAAVDSQVNEQHQKLDAMVKRLFSSLDALSNFHFTPRPVALEVTVTSVPALAVEEAIPIAVSDAARLAPEELFAKPKELPKGENERTQAERKQSRAAKKRVKAREKRQREANEKLADKLGRGNKHSKAKALKELEAAVGAGGKTRITIAGRGADAAATPKYGKSASFFGELQNQLQTAVADARAGKKDSGAKQPKPPQKTTQNAPPPGPKAQRKSNQE